MQRRNYFLPADESALPELCLLSWAAFDPPCSSSLSGSELSSAFFDASVFSFWPELTSEMYFSKSSE